MQCGAVALKMPLRALFALRPSYSGGRRTINHRHVLGDLRWGDERLGQMEQEHPVGQFQPGHVGLL
jgi:hypothetical protein